MRATKGIRSGIRAWLHGSDKFLFGRGASFSQARQLMATEVGITVSDGQFRRIAMLCRTAGRTRWWRGSRPPLPATNACGDHGLGLLFRAADVTKRLPEIDLRREPPAFVARLLCDTGFRVSIREAEQVIACMTQKKGGG